MTPVRRRLDAAGRAELIESFRSGVVIRELATQYGVGPTTVKSILRESGVQRMNMNQDEIVEAFRSGVIIRELAESHGISVATVKRILRKAKVRRSGPYAPATSS